MAFACSSTRIGSLLRSTLGSTRSMATTNKVYVGGIPVWIKESILSEAFSGFGDVSEAIIIRHVDTGESKGFGFVSFYDNDSVDAAIEGMDGQIVNNRPIRVRPASARS